MARVGVVTCVAVVSVLVWGGVRAVLVPYTLGKTTIMVDSEVLGHNSPLLAYLKEGMHLRRDGDAPLEPLTDHAVHDATLTQEAEGDEKLTSRTPEFDQHPVDTQDFHTSPDGALEIDIQPERRDPPPSWRPTPIALSDASGLYIEGQYVPIPSEGNNPPLYYNVQTPNVAQVSEKIHNIVTSLSPKLNDRAPSSSRHPPIPNALPLQLHARPGDTPPSLANTEGFTGVSVKHMVPEESISYEDHATNNDNLNFLLSDSHSKPFAHDVISPMGHVWGPAGDAPQHTRLHNDESVSANDEHEALFGDMVSLQNHKSDSQSDNNELQVTLTDSSADAVSTINTGTTILSASVTQESNNNTESVNEDSSTTFPHVIDTVPIPSPEVNTVPSILVDMITTEQVNTVTEPVREEETLIFPQEVDTIGSTLKEVETVNLIEELETVTPTMENIYTIVLPMEDVTTVIPIMEDIETVAPPLEEIDVVTDTAEAVTALPQDSLGIDVGQVLSIKMEELQREEVDEAMLAVREEEDQAALDEAMVDLFGSFFSSVTDSPDSESEDKTSTSFTSTNSDDPLNQGESDSSTLITDTFSGPEMDSVLQINEKGSTTGNDGFPPFPTKTIQPMGERHTSYPTLSSGDDPLTSLLEFDENTAVVGQKTERNPSGSNYPTQGQFHYSAATNFPIGDKVEREPSSPQGDSSLKQDFPRPADQGLKSWFDREPIVIFDPLHSPSPGSSLTQAADESQPAQDSFATKLDLEVTKEHNDPPHSVSPHTGTDLETTPDNDSNVLLKPVDDDVSTEAETAENDADSDTLEDNVDSNTPKDDDDLGDSNTPEDDDDSNTPKDDDDLDDSNAPEGDDDSNTPEGDDDLNTPESDDDSNTPEGDDDSNTPEGDDDSNISEGDDDSNTPEGDDDSNTPKGDDDSNTPEGDDDSNTPEGDDDSNTPEGDDDSNTPEGDDDSNTPEGDDDSNTPEGDDDSNIPEGDDDSNTPEGDDDSNTPEGDDDSNTPEGDDDSNIPEGDDDLNDSNTPEDDDDSEIPQGGNIPADSVTSENNNDSDMLDKDDDSDDSGAPHGDDATGNSDSGENNDDADDSHIPEDNDDSEAEDLDDSHSSDTLKDDDDSIDSAVPTPDTLRQTESNSSQAANTTTTNSTTSLVFPGAVLHNAGPEIFQKSACQCGLRFATKVVGGQATTINKYPWMVGLYDPSIDLVFCGAILITDTYVLSAAHCMLRKVPSDIKARLGATDKNSPYATDVSVVKLIPHKKYTANNFHKFDIGLIQLAQSLDYTEVIFPACLASPEMDFTDQQAVVTGWGKDSYDGLLQDNLQETTVKVLSTKDCRNDSLYKDQEVHRRIVCAAAAGKDACQGDSGGPLMSMQHGKYVVFGIVSWGVGCADKQYPGIYTRISSFGPWINRKMKADKTCLQSFLTKSKKAKKGTVGGPIRNTGSIDDFLSTWTQLDNENPTRRKTQANKWKQNHGHTSSEDEGGVGNTKKKGQVNKRIHNKVKDQQSSNNHNTNDGDIGQGQNIYIGGGHDAQDDNRHEQNVGVTIKHNKRKPLKDQIIGGLTPLPIDSVEDLSGEEEDWSSIPVALRGIAKLILQETNTDK